MPPIAFQNRNVGQRPRNVDQRGEHRSSTVAARSAGAAALCPGRLQLVVAGVGEGEAAAGALTPNWTTRAITRVPVRFSVVWIASRISVMMRIAECLVGSRPQLNQFLLLCRPNLSWARPCSATRWSR
jgi:hypothetical protein